MERWIAAALASQNKEGVAGLLQPRPQAAQSAPPRSPSLLHLGAGIRMPAKPFGHSPACPPVSHPPRKKLALPITSSSGAAASYSWRSPALQLQEQGGSGSAAGAAIQVASVKLQHGRQ